MFETIVATALITGAVGFTLGILFAGLGRRSQEAEHWQAVQELNRKIDSATQVLEHTRRMHVQVRRDYSRGVAYGAQIGLEMLGGWNR